MLLPSEPVPSIRPPKNRNAMMKNGIASASASHGTSTLAEISIGTTPRPVTIRIASHTAICSSPARAEPEQLAREDLIGIGRRQQHVDDLVLLLGRRALHQIPRRHQHRDQEQHHEDDRHRQPQDRRRGAAVADLAGPGHREALRCARSASAPAPPWSASMRCSIRRCRSRSLSAFARVRPGHRDGVRRVDVEPPFASCSPSE